MADFETIARVGEIPEGEGRAYRVNGRMVAVFHIAGEYRAISDTCPHMGASLASGYVEDAIVTCPWHAWRFCVKDGSWTDNPAANLGVDCFEVRLSGDDIQVFVPEPPARQSDFDAGLKSLMSVNWSGRPVTANFCARWNDSRALRIAGPKDPSSLPS